MIRISTIFVAICMAMIAASLGLVLHAVAGLNGQESATIALAAMTFMILYNAVSMRMRDRPDIEGRIADLSQGTTDLARQVGEFGRRLSAIEARVLSGTAAGQERMQALAGEIGELGTLVNELAQSVAAQEDLLSLGSLVAEPPEATPAPVRAAVAPAVAAPVVAAPMAATPMAASSMTASSMTASSMAAAPPPFATPAAAQRVEEDYIDAELDADLDVLAAGDPGQLLAAVTSAVDSNRIDIYLQPIVTLPQRKVRFYEAVSRLRDANDRLLTAEDFIETAEHAGLMSRIDSMVMQRCVQVLQRLTTRNKEVGVFCNVAAATLANPAAFAQCLDFLEASRALAPSLILEFKQAAFRGFGAIEREHLAALAQRGYRFSIDHVTDLKIEPRELADRGVRYIKVPAALLLDPQQTSAADIHAADLSGLLSRFGIDLVVERIEGERAVVDLLDYDVRFGQGFLFAAPRPLRPDTGTANGTAPSARPAPPEHAPREIPQSINGTSKPAQPFASRAEPNRAGQSAAIGNAALARRALRPT